MTTGRFTDSEISVPEAIVRVLEEAGIDTVFGMSGGNTGRIFSALATHTSTIRTILVRNEALATIAAESYARVSGKPAVAIGQGSWLLGHGIVGTLEALLGGSPLILFGDLSDGSPFSHHAPYQAGSGEYGTWDARRAYGGVTKEVMAPHEPVQAVQSVQLAIKHALAGQPGPVAVLFHSTALNGKVGPDSVPTLYPTAGYLRAPVKCTPDMSSVADALRSCKFPVLVLGGGVGRAGAQPEVRALAERVNAAVVTTAAGKGAFPEDHPLSAGVIGNFGSPLANEVVGRADTVIAIATKLGPSDTIDESPRLLNPALQQIVQIDIEPRNAAWTFPVDTLVIADARAALESLVADFDAHPVAAPAMEFRRRCVTEARQSSGSLQPQADSDSSPIHPQRAIAEMRRVFPTNVIVCSDAGENRLFMSRYFETREGGLYLQPAAAGGMGYAIPAAIGAKVHMPDRTIVAVCGDGGLGMSIAGLLTAVEENIPIIVVVLNNRALGWVSHGQAARGEPQFKAALHSFDYAGIARAIGFEAWRVSTPVELGPALRAAMEVQGPSLVDIYISTAQSFLDLRSPLFVTKLSSE